MGSRILERVYQVGGAHAAQGGTAWEVSVLLLFGFPRLLKVADKVCFAQLQAFALVANHLDGGHAAHVLYDALLAKKVAAAQESHVRLLAIGGLAVHFELPLKYDVE